MNDNTSNASGGEVREEREDHPYTQEESGESPPAFNHLQALQQQHQYFQLNRFRESQPRSPNSSYAVFGSSASQSSGIFYSIHPSPPGYIVPRNGYISLNPPHTPIHFENCPHTPYFAIQYANDRLSSDHDIAHCDLESSLIDSYNSGPASLTRENEAGLRGDNLRRLPEVTISSLVRRTRLQSAFWREVLDQDLTLDNYIGQRQQSGRLFRRRRQLPIERLMQRYDKVLRNIYRHYRK